MKFCQNSCLWPSDVVITCANSWIATNVRVFISINSGPFFFLSKQKAIGKKISAYGAAAKGVTLLNYCGIKSDIIDYVVDLNPSKQGKFLPGCQIPIVDFKIFTSNPPDILLVLAWNLSTELKSQLSDHINLGMKLIKAIPEVVYF